MKTWICDCGLQNSMEDGVCACGVSILELCMEVAGWHICDEIIPEITEYTDDPTDDKKHSCH